MKEQAMTTMITTEEKDREALARRMHEAITGELIPEGGAVEDIFKGMDQHVVLCAIADLAASLIVDANESRGNYCCNWREMVGEVHGEMLKWVQHLEDC
jgi:hypothetical protein